MFEKVLYQLLSVLIQFEQWLMVLTTVLQLFRYIRLVTDAIYHLPFEVPITTQKKCDLVLHDCEKVSMDSAHLAEFLGEDTVFTLGKNKEGNVFFLLADRNPDKVRISKIH